MAHDDPALDRMGMDDHPVVFILILDDSARLEAPQFLHEGLAHIQSGELLILLVMKMVVAVKDGSLVKIRFPSLIEGGVGTVGAIALDIFRLF